MAELIYGAITAVLGYIIGRYVAKREFNNEYPYELKTEITSLKTDTTDKITVARVINDETWASIFKVSPIMLDLSCTLYENGYEVTDRLKGLIDTIYERTYGKQDKTKPALKTAEPVIDKAETKPKRRKTKQAEEKPKEEQSVDTTVTAKPKRKRTAKPKQTKTEEN